MEKENEHPQLINHIVTKYLESISEKLAVRFKKEWKIDDDNSFENHADVTLAAVVEKFRKDQEESKGKKRKIDHLETNNDKSSSTKIKKNDHKKKKGEVNRKTVFIRNIDKDFNYDEHKEKFSKFGKVFGFTNSGKGHGFVTFSSESEAKAFIDEIDNTEIDGKTVQLNLARGSQGNNDGEEEGRKLFVHGIKQDVREEAIKEIFSKYGTVVDVFNPGKGFAFVTFDEASSAEKAVEKLNGKEKFGTVLSINVSKPKEKPSKGKKNKKKKKGALDLSESSRIFVKNVDKDADLEEVKTKFGQFGDVKDVYNPGKGFIFISFSQSKDAEEAVKSMDGEKLFGKTFNCNIARFKKDVKKKKK